jgi:hypothetical protein
MTKRMFARSAFLAAAGLLAACHCFGDDIRTVVKKVPFPLVPSEVRLKDVKPKDFEQYRIEARNGFIRGDDAQSYWVMMMTPSTVACAANMVAKTKLQDASDAQKDYEYSLAASYGKVGEKGYGDKITFLVSIHLHARDWKIADVADGWTFYLYVDKDKRYKPAKVDMGQPSYSGPHFTNTATVTFNNLDPETKQPILTSDTRSISLAVAGAPWQFKAEYQFVPDKPKK